MMGLGDIVCPPRFSHFRRLGLKWQNPHIIDVGCGNNSPKLTKKWFNNCHYVGVDIQRYNNDDESMALVDQFVLVTPDGDGYDAIPDSSADIILMNHVVEHMPDPATVIRKMCAKLKPGGVIWIAFPSVKSLSFPSAIGTLQFCDDDTHIRVVDVKDVSNVLLDNGLKVVHAGPTRDLLRAMVGAFILPLALLNKLVTGKLYARGLWYLYGFEDHVLAVKRSPSGATG